MVFKPGRGISHTDFTGIQFESVFVTEVIKMSKLVVFENNYTTQAHVLEIASRVCDVQYCTAFLNAVAVPYMGIMLAQNH